MTDVFVGLDLADPYARRPRPADRAVLFSDGHCLFDRWDYVSTGDEIVPDGIGSFVLLVDGPQGLAGSPNDSMRLCEREVGGVPGRTPYYAPPLGKPYAGFIRGSVELFYNLVSSGRVRLLSRPETPAEAPDAPDLMEVYPGSAWRVLSGERLPKKQLVEGRHARHRLLAGLGLRFPSGDLPTHDQLDAAVAAYTGFLWSQGHARIVGAPPELDGMAHVIREGYIVNPRPGPALFMKADPLLG
ncbi:MAG: DUF429 domain-containing protein [Chloroflexi bacterium]|nr:DUF429 domain-containing protein [Chloroflexota bacterium]